ncbi:MAG: hypothetical protein B6241_05375 [Spirochaetaceae bacterium 4572_59]|nr:MAG: hypothetical protein B6241_05375 [Spirochaetaceae bacterium 4572_59]
MNKPIINRKLILLFIFSLLFLAGCVSHPFNSPAKQILSNPSWKKQRSQYEFSSGIIEVETDLHKKEIARNGLLNLNLLLEEENQEDPENRTQEALVSLYLREYAFMKNFKPLKSLTLHMLIRDQEGRELGSYYFSTESKESFYSSSYLFKQLKRGCGSLL